MNRANQPTTPAKAVVTQNSAGAFTVNGIAVPCEGHQTRGVTFLIDDLIEVFALDSSKANEFPMDRRIGSDRVDPEGASQIAGYAGAGNPDAIDFSICLDSFLESDTEIKEGESVECWLASLSISENFSASRLFTRLERAANLSLESNCQGREKQLAIGVLMLLEAVKSSPSVGGSTE